MSKPTKSERALAGVHLLIAEMTQVNQAVGKLLEQFVTLTEHFKQLHRIVINNTERLNKLDGKPGRIYSQTEAPGLYVQEVPEVPE